MDKLSSVITEILSYAGFLFGIKIYVENSDFIPNIFGGVLLLGCLYIIVNIVWKLGSNDTNKLE